jgi:hypothetical protein
MGLLVEKSRWGRIINEKMAAMQGSPCGHTALTLLTQLLALQNHRRKHDEFTHFPQKPVLEINLKLKATAKGE